MANTIVKVTQGGTGLSSIGAGSILVSNAADTLTTLAGVATGNALISTGVGSFPIYGKIGLTTHVSGTLPATSGGTGTNTYTTGEILYASATDTLSKLPAGTNGHVLTLSGGVPTWAAAGGADGNGIYTGSGTVPTSVVATLTDTLTFTGDVANTATMADRLIIGANSTGTALTGFGPSVLFRGESSTTNDRDMARIGAAWTTATDASREAKVSIELGNNAGALTEIAQFNVSTNNAGALLVGSATPVTLTNANLAPGTTYTIGGNSNSITLGGSTGTVNIGTSTGNVIISSSANSNVAPRMDQTSNNVGASLCIGNTTHNITAAGTKIANRVNSGFAPASGTTEFRQWSFQGTYNQTGTASGNIYSVEIDPTLTAVLGTYYAFTIRPNQGWAINQIGTSASNLLAGTTYIGGGTTPSELRFYEGSASGTDYTGFVAPATLSANQMYTLPSDTPNNGDVLTWNTGGTLSWEAPGAGGNGIYGGSGSIAAAAVATVGLASSFTIDYNNSNPAIAVSDNVGTTIGSDDGLTLASVADNSIGLSTAGGASLSLTGTTADIGFGSGGYYIDAAQASITGPYIAFRNDTAANGAVTRFYEGTTNGINYISVAAPASIGADTAYILPVTPTDGYLLKYNTGGQLSWVDPTTVGGNGIYGGSGTIASAAVATLTSGSTFTIDWNGGTNGLFMDDTAGTYYIQTKNGLNGVQTSTSYAGLFSNESYFRLDATAGGSYTNNPISINSGHLSFNSVTSPAQITVDQNNYSPTNMAVTNVLRISTDASRNITGIDSSGVTQPSGRILTIHNIGSFDVVLVNESASSTAGNRFAIGADITIGANQSHTLIYDNTSTRWRSFVTDTGGAASDHGSLGGLADDDHAQYALLAGRAGGQTLIGGTAASNNLTFQSTSNITKGDIYLGTGDDEQVTVNTNSPQTNAILTIEGSGTSGSTFGWVHRNSAGAVVGRITDAGYLHVGSAGASQGTARLMTTNQTGTWSSTITNQINNFHFAAVGGSSADNANLSLMNCGNNRGVIFFQRTNGSTAAPTTTVNGDTSGSFVFSLYDGTSFLNTASIEVVASGTVSTNVAPQRLSILTGETNGRTERFHVAPNGNVGIGYSGGTLASYILDINSTNAVRLPLGTTAQRPTGAAGLIRGNSTTSLPDYYNGSTWISLGNGIYTGSGTIATGAVATVTASSTFRFNYNSGNPSILIDDLNDDTTIYSGDGNSYVFVDDVGIDIIKAHQMQLLAAPATDHQYSGITMQLVANEAQAFGDVVYIQADGDAALADANATTTAPAVAMCTQTVTATNTATYMTYGIARDDTWAWTVGGLIYLSTTGTSGNTLTQTAPSGTGDVVQVVGIATHADRMIFNPSLTFSTVA